MVELRLSLPAPLSPDMRDAINAHLGWSDPGVSSVRCKDGPPEVVVWYDGPSSAATVRTVLADDLASMLAGLSGFVSKNWYDNGAVALPHAPPSDPFPEAVERQWVTAEVDGAMLYAGPLAVLYRRLDQEFARRFTDLGAQEVVLPSMLNPAGLHRTGSLANAAHQANFVFHLARRREVVSQFARQQRASARPGGTLAGLLSSAEDPDAVLAPAVCQPVYRALAGRTIADTYLVSAYCRAYRYEGPSMEGMRRLREFGVREVVCVGPPQPVADIRERLLSTLADLMTEGGIRGRIATASDPFFTDTYAQLRQYQLSFAVKHEAQAQLPFEGSHLAIGSVNHHGDHFARAWEIRTADGELAHSCCLGLGIDRWCYVILAQAGFDEDRWPFYRDRLVTQSDDR